MPVVLNVNGQTRDLDIDPTTPLLWVIREDLGLIPKPMPKSTGAVAEHLSARGVAA